MSEFNDNEFLPNNYVTSDGDSYDDYLLDVERNLLEEEFLAKETEQDRKYRTGGDWYRIRNASKLKNEAAYKHMVRLVHVKLEKYCSKSIGKYHRFDRKLGKAFRMVSAAEFRLRKIISTWDKNRMRVEV